MSKLRTHYDNLQVMQTASDEVIKGAYRSLAQKWHPDKNPDNREGAERVLKIINQAYEVLSDPIKRREHDEWIASQNNRHTREREQAYQSQTPPPKYTKAPKKQDLSIRPWVRFWARTLDMYLLVIFLKFTILVFYPSIFFNVGQITIYMFYIFMEVFFESLLLNIFGTTPGKWLFKIKIEHRYRKIYFSDALSRTFNVWWRGLGAGIPIIAAVTQVIAYLTLTKNGQTSWDADGDFIITHETIGNVRVTVAALIFFLILGMVSV